jgi:hypothetical protein
MRRREGEGGRTSSGRILQQLSVDGRLGELNVADGTSTDKAVADGDLFREKEG